MEGRSDEFEGRGWSVWEWHERGEGKDRERDGTECLGREGRAVSDGRGGRQKEGREWEEKRRRKKK